ncbi:MAG: sulfurtransferase TusA family protein [Methanosarcinales archaeon]|nr:sulfurtransferase TusA family protein [Methanosarcinales archaeon]
MKLEELDSGDTLVATYDNEPAIGNVSRSLKSEGNKIITIEEIGSELWNIVIEKA